MHVFGLRVPQGMAAPTMGNKTTVEETNLKVRQGTFSSHSCLPPSPRHFSFFFGTFCFHLFPLPLLSLSLIFTLSFESTPLNFNKGWDRKKSLILFSKSARSDKILTCLELAFTLSYPLLTP